MKPSDLIKNKYLEYRRNSDRTVWNNSNWEEQMIYAILAYLDEQYEKEKKYCEVCIQDQQKDTLFICTKHHETKEN